MLSELQYRLYDELWCRCYKSTDAFLLLVKNMDYDPFMKDMFVKLFWKYRHAVDHMEFDELLQNNKNTIITAIKSQDSHWKFITIDNK